MANEIKNKTRPIEAADIDIAVRMLRTYVEDPAIDPLVSNLEALKSDPANPTCQARVIEAFNDLGVLQGAALTYAPYLNIFVSDDPFGDGPA